MSSREKFEQAIKARFGDLIDYRVCKNSDGEYIDWNMQVAWWAWQAAETDMAVQLANAESKCRELAAENAYLLNGASRELNTSWMFHKTMLGAQAALVCLSHGYQASAREWLEGTTDEAGAEIPDDISVGELHEWFESNMVSNGGNSGFLTRKEAEVAIRKECPATDVFLAEVRAQARNELLTAFRSSIKRAGLTDGDSVTTFEAHDALKHCIEQLNEGAVL